MVAQSATDTTPSNATRDRATSCWQRPHNSAINFPTQQRRLRFSCLRKSQRWTQQARHKPFGCWSHTLEDSVFMCSCHLRPSGMAHVWRLSSHARGFLDLSRESAIPQRRRSVSAARGLRKHERRLVCGVQSGRWRRQQHEGAWSNGLYVSMRHLGRCRYQAQHPPATIRRLHKLLTTSTFPLLLNNRKHAR